jgi:hypothetical protein
VSSIIPAGSNLTITSRLLPPIVVDLSGGTQPLGTQVTGISAGLAVSLLKPTVTVNLAGQRLTSFSPAGVATKNYWPQIRIGLLVGFGFAAFWLIRKVL